MSIEEIKEVAGIIEKIAAHGENAGSVWIYAHYGLALFKDVTSFTLGALFIYLAYRFLRTLTPCGAYEEYLGQLRDRLNVGSPGTLTSEEFLRTKSKLQMVLDEYEAMKGKNNG